jgi:sigma-B regulation protein RsbU (phosphoserine phosphatase)
MAAQVSEVLRSELLMRRKKLESFAAASRPDDYIRNLLREVDAALTRMDSGSYGLCESCHEAIEADRLQANPLARFCLDHLSPREQRALEEDLELAARIQKGLLPRPGTGHHGWQTAFHYQPAGPVSGDYCDLVAAEDGSLYFMIGDVTGKGIAASILMSQLHALFRALIGVGLPLQTIVARASRVFCESTLPSHFATLVCGKAGIQGDVEICNAGHLPPLLVRGRSVSGIESTALPLGLFCDGDFAVSRERLEPGDLLLLFTDGLSEAQNRSGEELGVERLSQLAQSMHPTTAESLVRACVGRASDFRAAAAANDDLTVLAIQRTG